MYSRIAIWASAACTIELFLKMAWVDHKLTISRDWSWAVATGWKVMVSEAVSRKSHSFQSQLAAGQVVATLPGLRYHFPALSDLPII